MYLYIVVKKTMCSPGPGYHHNGFVVTHVLRYIMYMMSVCRRSYITSYIILL